MKSTWLAGLLPVAAIAIGIHVTAPAVAQSSKVIAFDKSSVTLTVPAGYCQLDPGQARDAQLISLVTKLLAGHNDLLLYLGDCQQLVDWRTSQRQTLDSSIQVQIASSLRKVDFANDPNRDGIVASVCAELRKKVPADINAIADTINGRLQELTKSLKINDIQLIGVVGEDTYSCYTAMLQKVRYAGTDESVIAIMYVTAMIGNRLLFVYHFGAGGETGIFERLQTAAEAHIASLQAANP